MVEGARLESVYAGNRIESSNLFLSANAKRNSLINGLLRLFILIVVVLFQAPR